MTDRLDDLERRLAALEDLERRLVAMTETAPPSPPSDIEARFWALEELRRRSRDTPGAVLFTGTWQPDESDGGDPTEKPARNRIDWQFGRTVDDLMDHDWTAAAAPLAALGHPVRVELLKRVLTGTTATRDLAETEGLGTSGQLHHHLRALVAAGWLRLRQRGDYEVPGERVIPLMTILVAAIG